MLYRTGSANITPCKYILPDNTTDMLLLMSTLKTVEVGVFMSLAESLPTEATSAAILLSSMGSIAAAQNAFLGVYASPSTRTAPFNTPLSATLAYNLAWKYVQPGSCNVELPVPLLPTLSISDSVVGHASTNSTVTLMRLGLLLRALGSRYSLVGLTKSMFQCTPRSMLLVTVLEPV